MGSILRPIPDSDCQGWRSVPFSRHARTFADLESAAPAIAAFVRENASRTPASASSAPPGSDGWPRVSGWELFVCDGRIYVGSMPNAVKVQGPAARPPLLLLTPLADKDDLAGEAKLFCVAREVDDPEE